MKLGFSESRIDSMNIYEKSAWILSKQVSDYQDKMRNIEIILYSNEGLQKNISKDFENIQKKIDSMLGVEIEKSNDSKNDFWDKL